MNKIPYMNELMDNLKNDDMKTVTIHKTGSTGATFFPIPYTFIDYKTEMEKKNCPDYIKKSIKEFIRA